MTLLTLSAAFLAGVFLGLRLQLPFMALGLFALAAGLSWLLLLIAKRPALPTVLILAAVVGAAIATPPGDAADARLAAFRGVGTLQVEGVVATDPEAVESAMRVRLAVDRIRRGEDWVEASGDVLVTLHVTSELVRRRESPHVRYGDRLLLEGFDYPAYLARQGIGTVMSFPRVTLVQEGEGSFLSRWLHGLRRRMADSIAKAVPEPQASLGQALLLGLRDDMPEDLVERFRATGTSHLLAISGLHLGIILGLGLGASRWLFGRRGQYYLLAPLALMWAYAALAGMSPSVTRAAIMGSVYLAALALGRPRSVLPALGLAAALMVAHSPPVLLSVSFQLSFTAMAGIALLAAPIASRLRALLGPTEDRGGTRNSLLDFVAFTAAMTVAATLATLPLVAFYFRQISLVGVPATMLALPALPLVLVTQAVAGVLGLIATSLALPLGWLAWAATGYLIGVVELVARLPGASFETGQVGPVLVWAYYGSIMLVWIGARRARRLWPLRAASLRLGRLPLPARGVVVPLWVLPPAILLPALVWTAALSMPDGRLHVTFADVGQGDSALIITPRSNSILVDGVPGPLEAARLVGDRLPFWDRTVEMVVLTQPHADHARGLTELLRRYRVERVMEREIDYESRTYAAWKRALGEEGAVVTQARSGQVIVTDDGVLIQVLWPPEQLQRGTASDVDNASIVLRLVYGDVSFLLTGDMFAEAEASLVRRELRWTVTC